MAKDLTVVFQDRPGRLLAAAEAMGAAGINMRGGCAVVGEEAIGHFAVEDDELVGARQAFISAGAEVRAERDALIVSVAHQAGGLAGAIRPLASAGINIELFYLTQDGALVLGVNDVERARSALGLI